MIKFIRKLISGAFKAFKTANMGFVLVLTGAVAQSFHTYSISVYLSSFEGYMKVFQALLIAIFFGSGLVYFTIKASNADKVLDKSKFLTIANYFAWFEAFINLYYWTNKLVILPGFDNADWFSLIPAVPFSIALPVILKAYAGEVKDDTEIIKLQVKEIEELKNNLETVQVAILDNKEKLSDLLDKEVIITLNKSISTGVFSSKLKTT